MNKSRRSIAAGKFKAGCLQILDQVAETGEVIIITKRGRPIAQVVPLQDKKSKPLKNSITYHGEILNPIDELWDAER